METPNNRYNVREICLDCQLDYPQSTFNFCKGKKITISYQDSNNLYHRTTSDSEFKIIHQTKTEKNYYNNTHKIEPHQFRESHQFSYNYFIDGNIVDDTTFHKVLYFLKQTDSLSSISSYENFLEELDVYEKWIFKTKEKSYYIIVLRNQTGNEIIIDTKDNELEAVRFIDDYDKSKIPEGYKMGYFWTQVVLE